MPIFFIHFGNGNGNGNEIDFIYIWKTNNSPFDDYKNKSKKPDLLNIMSVSRSVESIYASLNGDLGLRKCSLVLE